MTDLDPSRGGIKVNNLDPSLYDILIQLTSDNVAKMGQRPGTNALNVFSVAANVVNGDTITVGADVYEVDIINTDTTANLASGLNNSSDPVQVTLDGAPALAVVAGDLLRVDNEILKVITKVSSTVYICARARCGTSIASHSSAADVFQSDAAPASNIPVGLVTTLTAAAFGPAFIDEFNNAKSGTTRLTAKASTEYANFTAYSLASGAQLVIIANEPGADSTATTSDMANSTDSVWATATVVGGSDSGQLAVESQSREVSALESSLGVMNFAFPFDVGQVLVQTRVTATGQPVAFNGKVEVNAGSALAASVVTITNTGPASTAYITPFDSTMTVSVVAFEK